VEAGAVVGGDSAPYAFSIDSVPPAQVADVTQIADSFIGNLPDGATTADQTPTINGTLSAPLAGGEQMRLRRTDTGRGTVVDQLLSPSGTSFSFTEGTLVGAGTYRYEALVIDAAGNIGPATGGTRTVTINPSAVPLPGAAATITSIAGQPSGSLINVNTPVLLGTIQRPLGNGEVVVVFRGGAPVGNATISVGQSSWSYTNSLLADGAYTFTAQVQQAANPLVFGQMSPNASVTIDATVPAQTITISGIFDDASVNVGGNNTADSTPRISGTLSGALGAGETLLLTRNPGNVSLAITQPVGTSWTYTEASALASGTTYTYTLRVRDTAGNVSVSNPSQTVAVLAPLPNVTALSVSGAQNGFVSNLTPQVTGTISAAMPGGATVRVFRDGTFIGNASVVNTTFFNITDPANLGQTQRTYTARVENGTAYGTTVSGATVTVDTVAPTQTTTVVQVRSNVAPNTTVAGATPPDDQVANGGQTNDPTPVYRFGLNQALGSGESVQVLRAGSPVSVSLSTLANTACGAGFAACYEFSAPTGLVISTDLVNETNLPAPAVGSAFQSVGTASFTIRVVDLAGNTSVASAARSVNVGYFPCSQQRAQATYAAAGNVGSHITLSAGQNPAQRCTSCHSNVSPNDPANLSLGTPAGNFVAVPMTTAQYWCRRPG
jgi:hypothetical protein